MSRDIGVSIVVTEEAVPMDIYEEKAQVLILATETIQE